MAGLLDGVLPYLYSQSDRLKRHVGGLLSDPMGTLEQTAGGLLDSHKAQQGLLSQAFANEKRPFQVTDKNAMMQAAQNMLNGPLGMAPAGITAWHGSPHVFDKFDSGKIGTGEGAQAYGHGLYLAENPNVAKDYAESLGATQFYANGRPLSGDSAWAASHLVDNGGDVRQVLDWAKSSLKPTADGRKAAASLVREARKLRGADLSEGTGQLYKVDLPDSAVAKMLDWDKPLSQQPGVIDPLKAAGMVDLEKNFGPSSAGVFRELGFGNAGGLTGEQLYRRLIEAKMEGKGIGAGDFGRKAAELEAAQALRQAGLPGIRYLDGGSRGAGAGSSNFVVFPGEESLLQILERNGQPLR
jgi:hypothetical protein